jgi:hypothetical protein
MNKSSTGLVRFPSGTPGGVAGKVVGAVEVFHHLHCLDLLRKKIHENYYKDKDGNWEAGPEVMRLHVDHCIDMLRQKLMCDGDVGKYSIPLMPHLLTALPSTRVQIGVQVR